jgi:galactosylceramidase
MSATTLPAAPEVVGPTVTISGDDPGRVFEGVGALSAGASSRLLLDYPEPQRSQILDYLFQPNFGASLHQLKVEIGGEVNSTDGTEASHARTREELLHPRPEYYQRGYEWWLMVEAMKRNPAVMLDILQWGAPPWIGEEEVKHVDPARREQGEREFTQDPEGKTVVRKKLGDREFRFFSQDNADYIAAFILGAKRYHGLDIDFCGVWNEITYEAAWIKQLRRTLDTKGLGSVKIVAPDLYTPNRWEIAKDLQADPELAKAIHAIGAHYLQFKSTPEAQASGKPLYASEDISSKGDWQNAKKYARAFNRNYIQGRMTKTIYWSLIAAYYDYLDFSSCGPMRAVTPWSGFYEVQPAIWATAHTTQFAQPGWRYLDNACVLLPDDSSCVALLSPNGRDYSVIIETANAKKPQPLTLKVDAGLSQKPLALWRTTEQSQFERLPDVQPTNGVVQLTLEPGAFYSLTTTTGQRKGAAPVPPDAPFPLPYADDFESGKPGRLPKYFSDHEGAFEFALRPDGKGQCLFQAVTQQGIPWLRKFLWPHTLIGPAELNVGLIECEAMVLKGGSVGLGARIQKSKAAEVPGYWLEVSTTNQWTLKAHERLLAKGEVPFAPDQWHTLALRFNGDRITAEIDGQAVAAVTDATYALGACALMSGWNQAYFDNFKLNPARPAQ